MNGVEMMEWMRVPSFRCGAAGNLQKNGMQDTRWRKSNLLGTASRKDEKRNETREENGVHDRA
jgi:hypothetical protein